MRGFGDLSLRPLPHYQSYPPLRPPSRGGYHLGANTVVPQAVVSLNRVHNIHLHQKYQVIVTELHGMDGMG